MRHPSRPALAASAAAPRVAGTRRSVAAAVAPAYTSTAGYGAPARTATGASAGYAGGPAAWWALATVEQVPELRWPTRTGVYERMRTHTAVSSSLRAVRTPIESTRWYIDPNGARPEVVEHVARDLGLPVGLEVVEGATQPRRRGRFSWSQHLREALTCLHQGHAFFEQEYRLDEATQLYHLRRLGFRRPESLAAVNVATDGGLDSIEQHAQAGATKPGERVVIEVDRLVAYVLDREGGNWLGNSLIRPAYGHWLLACRLMPVHANTIERNGMGVPTYTDQENGTKETLAAGLAQATAARAGSVAGVGVPHGATLKYEGVVGQLPDALPGIRYHDERIAATVLAHFLNLGQQTGTGSYALGSSFVDFFTMSLQTVAQLIADTVNEHVIEDLVDINYGEDAAAPLVRFDHIGSQPQLTAGSLKQLVDAGLVQPDRELEEFLRQRYDIPSKQAPGTPGSAIPTNPDGSLVAPVVEVPAAVITEEVAP